MKRLDILFSEEDLRDLLGWVRQLPVALYTYWGETVGDGELDGTGRYFLLPEGERPILRQAGRRTCVSDETPCIWMEPTRISEQGLYTPGTVGTASEKHPKLQAVYNELTRHIKSTYHRSWDKAFYVAPKLYERWHSGQVSFHFFVDAAVLDVPQAQFSMEAFARHMEAQGYRLLEDGRDIREGVENLGAENLIVCRPDAALNPWLAARRRYFYPDSECVFLWKRKNGVRFVADAQLFERNTGSSVAELFREIEIF